MDQTKHLLDYIQRIIPEMTMERMVEELGKCHYSIDALIMTFENNCEKKTV